MRKNLKKIIAISIVATMTLSLVACGGNGSKSKNKKYNIGICQLVEHPTLDAATKGFKEALIIM